MLFFLKRKDIKGVILVKLKFVKGFVLRVASCELLVVVAGCPPLLRYGR